MEYKARPFFSLPAHVLRNFSWQVLFHCLCVNQKQCGHSWFSESRSSPPSFLSVFRRQSQVFLITCNSQVCFSSGTLYYSCKSLNYWLTVHWSQAFTYQMQKQERVYSLACLTARSGVPMRYWLTKGSLSFHVSGLGGTSIGFIWLTSWCHC